MPGRPKPMWRTPEWKSAYDAVIIGGGVHGLAAAYYLAKKHGIKKTAVVERGLIGCAASGRNTGVVRADHRTQDTIRLHKEGLALWPELTRQLGLNLMFFQSGVLTLAHNDEDMSEIALRAASLSLNGINTEILSAQECLRKIPAFDISDAPEHPVIGGMFHPQGGMVNPDAVIWGLAKGASRLGVDIHQETDVTGIGTEAGRVSHVHTAKGAIRTPMVLNAAGADAKRVARMAGLAIPVQEGRVEFLAVQPLKPLLNHVIRSGAYPCYINQNLKGEIVSRGEMKPSQDEAAEGISHFLHSQIWAMTRLLPCLKGAQVIRTGAGPVDAAVDGSPILDAVSSLQGFYMDCGWGDSGFSAGPVAGKYMAEFMVKNQKPGMIRPFGLDRFEKLQFSGERKRMV